MKKNKTLTTRTVEELTVALGLPAADSLDIELRAEINDRIIAAVKRLGVSHAQVAKAARTSRTRITAIMNRNTHHVSTDLLLRILGALGYRARLSVYSIKPAA